MSSGRYGTSGSAVPAQGTSGERRSLASRRRQGGVERVQQRRGVACSQETRIGRGVVGTARRRKKLCGPGGAGRDLGCDGACQPGSTRRTRVGQGVGQPAVSPICSVSPECRAGGGRRRWGGRWRVVGSVDRWSCVTQSADCGAQVVMDWRKERARPTVEPGEVRAGGGDGQVTGRQDGSRLKAATRSVAHGQCSARRSVVRRAERTTTPAVCSSV
jgi:hypothetical protein